MITALRPIECSTFADVAVPEILGPAPQLQWIAIEKLVVDDSYQRPADSHQSRKNIRAIAGGFDWRRFAPVIVSPVAGGRYAVVDGQHRCTAALLIGVAEVPCSVILADRREQAKAFEAINGQVTRIMPSQIYKAQLAQGDPRALRIDDVTRKAGVRLLTFNPSSITRKPHETTALKAIARVIDLFGDVTAVMALKVIRHNAGDLTGYLSSNIISAVATVLGDHTEWRDAPTLFDVMSRLDLEDTYTKARALALKHRGTTSQDQLQALLITHLDAAFKETRAA